ncbi:MAG: hypothetical protein HYS65_05685 [Betaproteobacteria bacterium]|nr:hypothetical protein [Betaproteobacteria bacterium]
MAHTVEQLAQSFHKALKAEPGPAGRRKVCELLQAALTDAPFIASTFSDSTSDRHLLYEDPELGFCIFAHNYKGAKDSPPHDHGPSWAIYGQVQGEDLHSPSRASSTRLIRIEGTNMERVKRLKFQAA